MTWEMPDRNWVKLLAPSVFFGLIAVVLLLKFITSDGIPTVASYQSSCAEQNGEWLFNSAKPTCVFPGGRLVVFDDRQDGSLLPPSRGIEGVVSASAPSGRVATSDDASVPSTDPAPECGYGQVGSFADYPATDTYRGRPHKPDFSTFPDAAKYRTAIMKDVTRGVNFAGVYVISTWGRAQTFNETKTIGFAIVDARDGRIIDYSERSDYVSWSGAVLSVDYQKDSRFFRVHSSTGPFAEIISNGNEVQCGRY